MRATVMSAREQILTASKVMGNFQLEDPSLEGYSSQQFITHDRTQATLGIVICHSYGDGHELYGTGNPAPNTGNGEL